MYAFIFIFGLPEDKTVEKHPPAGGKPPVRHAFTPSRRTGM
jgi:hypothetical protein